MTGKQLIILGISVFSSLTIFGQKESTVLINGKATKVLIAEDGTIIENRGEKRNYIKSSHRTKARPSSSAKVIPLQSNTKSTNARKSTHFVDNQNGLSDENKQVLKEFSSLLSTEIEKNLQLTVYTKSLGSSESMSLAQQQIKACRDFLVTHGVEAERISMSVSEDLRMSVGGLRMDIYTY